MFVFTSDYRLKVFYPLSILLAEDNVVNQKVAMRILERFGYRADVASNGQEVLHAMKRQKYDLILMDIQMPEMDGVEAMQRIRQNWPTAQQPHIVAMTANALNGDSEHYLSLGMDEYLSKPIQVDLLEQALINASKARQQCSINVDSILAAY